VNGKLGMSDGGEVNMVKMCARENSVEIRANTYPSSMLRVAVAKLNGEKR